MNITLTSCPSSSPYRKDDQLILENHGVTFHDITKFLDTVTKKTAEHEKKYDLKTLVELEFNFDDQFKITKSYGLKRLINKLKTANQTNECYHCKKAIPKKYEYSICCYDTEKTLRIDNFAFHILRKHQDFGDPSSSHRINLKQICEATLYNQHLSREL